MILSTNGVPNITRTDPPMGLTRKMLEAVRLADEGLTDEAIAARLGISRSAATYRIRRAMAAGVSPRRRRGRRRHRMAFSQLGWQWQAEIAHVR